MNRIYKVIYSKARQCYIVVSELAKSNHKSSQQGADHTNTPALARIIAVALAAGALTWGSVPGVSWAADNTTGKGNGVAIGTGSNAPKAENVAIGKGAEIKYSNGASSATGDVIVGSGAVIDNYASQGGSIAIGKNATIENMTGKQESLFSLGQTKYHSGNALGTLQIPDNPENVAGSIALGDNTYARTGSIMIGSHNYRGLIGDQTVDTSKTKGYVKTKDYGININATTLGTNSFNQGAFSSVTGAYSIISGKYDGRGFSPYGAQNFGATITGSLNSIESATSSSIYSGIANSIVGTANRTFNSNGSLIFGAGNEIKNSITDISAPTSGGDSAKALQDSLMKAVQNSKSGGATLVIGGGNKADYTQKTQIMGVSNTVTGTKDSISYYNLIDGYKNTATHVKHATVIGSENNVSGEEKDNVEGLILLGDKRNIWSRADNSVVIGSSDDTGHSYVTRPDTVVIGHNAYIEDHGGNTSGGGDIAIGHNSFVENYVNQSGSIAFGENTHVRNSVGSTENAFVLGQYETTQDPAGTTIPTDVAKMNASIAIGENTFARTGSLMIGTHKYTGEIGDTTVDTSDAVSMAKANQQINETVLGTNSFSLGAFSTVTGAYSIISGDYDKEKWNNFGSSITGSLNSIESKTATAKNAGVASHIIGTANRMQNTNGAVVLGSGNEITDSNAEMSIPTSNNVSAKDLSEKIRTSIQKDSGGAASVVGNGNKVKKSTNVAVVGSKNTVTSTTNSQIFGDNRIVTGADGAPIDGAVIIGSAAAESPLTTDKKNVTILGYNANATVEGGVALGADSVASIDKDQHGYDFLTKVASASNKKEWKSSWAAVSVGDAEHTRQITNLAAGFNDTDAVNVAQLKNVMNMPVHIYSGGTINTTGTQITNNMTISNLQLDFGDGLKALEVGNDGDKRVLVTLDKDALKNDPAFKGPKGDKGDAGVQGLKGDKGDKGDTGAQGPAGKDGKDGKDGGVGTVTDDGSNITVTMTNTETDSTKPANYQVSLKKDINIDSVTADKVTAKEMTTDRLTINKDVSIEQGSKNAVNAGTVYNETRVKQDGKYVKASNTAGQNITALDNQVASNASNITNINGRVNNLDSKVNKVGAGAAALAALHPLDFDPEDKWDFAVGYGNYRDANSVAVGAFYRPDDDTMFSVGTNFGNGENMINAGVSFKFGPKGKSQVRPGSTQEITELRATVARQDEQLKKQDSEIKELKAMVQQLLAAQDKKAVAK